MKQRSILPIFFFLLTVGCTSVSRVGEYSNSALQTLKKYEEVGYTFDTACRDRCYYEQVRTLKLATSECNCDAEQSADSLSNVLYKAIKGYYDGLVKLSDDKLTTYKTESLAKELKSGAFADLKIDKLEVDAYTKLSTVILNAFTDRYRRKKLKYYVEVANEPIQILMGALEKNVAANLSGKLNVHKARIKNIYFDLLQDPAASGFEKKRIIDEYNLQSEEVEAREKQLATFARGLKTIRSGHQKLYDNRNKVNAKEMKKILATYASDLEDIISAFNKIKSK